MHGGRHGECTDMSKKSKDRLCYPTHVVSYNLYECKCYVGMLMMELWLGQVMMSDQSIPSIPRNRLVSPGAVGGCACGLWCLVWLACLALQQPNRIQTAVGGEK